MTVFRLSSYRWVSLVGQWNRIPFRFIGKFQDDCEALILMEHLPRELRAEMPARTFDSSPLMTEDLVKSPRILISLTMAMILIC